MTPRGEETSHGDGEFGRYLLEVRRLLAQQRRVAGLVSHQNMQKRDLVEGLVHRQHHAQLKSLLDRHPASLTARIVSSLERDERIDAWRQFDENLCDEVLELLPDGLREELLEARPQPTIGNMLNVFGLDGGRLVQLPVATRADLESVRAVWIDLVSPSPGLVTWVASHLHIKVPDHDGPAGIKTRAKYHTDEGGDIHLEVDFLVGSPDHFRNAAVTLALHGETLLSIRMEELPVFRLQRLRARTQAGYVDDGRDVLLDLLAANVEYSAFALERMYGEFESMGRRRVDRDRSDDDAARALAWITRSEDTNGRIRRNVLDSRRALSYLLRCRQLTPAQQDYARQILRDIESLDSHTSFLSGKINFLMDETIGFISISQNRRVSKLAGVGVVFAPVSIVAGIGGMSEFSAVTRALPWQWAYGGFVAGMIVLGIALYGGLRLIERMQSGTERLGP